ncbi:hypothetical protein [Streptomyces sp. NPDC057413]|uniref:hypothetical protein n=1 Tax=Streptomyces sp. NPDC057413 TaxID=3346124 RepID=UPI00367FBD34
MQENTETVPGNALADPGSQALVGSEHAHIGQAWWFALPMVQNQSSKPLELIDAKVLDLPKGLKVREYKAFNSRETDGVGLIFSDGDSQFPVAQYTDYSKRHIQLNPKEDNSYYYSVKVLVTGKISGEASQCRFTYEQDGSRYRQDIPCRFTLSLEK